MASISMKNIATGTLNGGGEHEIIWNNPPIERVWQVNVVPSCYEDTYGSTAFAKASYTWHLEQERTGFEGTGSFKTPVFKRRIRIKVRNEAGQKINYAVFLSWTTP